MDTLRENKRLEESTELVYSFLRTHEDAALHWVDTNTNSRLPYPIFPEIEPGDPSYGFWEIYSPTNYTTHEYGFPWKGEDMNMLAYEIMDWKNK